MFDFFGMGQTTVAMQYILYCMYLAVSSNHTTAPAAPCFQKPQLSLSLSIALLHSWSLQRLGVMKRTFYFYLVKMIISTQDDHFYNNNVASVCFDYRKRVFCVSHIIT